MRNQGQSKSIRDRNRRRAQGNEASQGPEEDEGDNELEKHVSTSSRANKSTLSNSCNSPASSSQELSATPLEDDRVWVQCNTCDKWRALPNTVDPVLLPDIWFCELNSYDADRNCCEVRKQIAVPIVVHVIIFFSPHSSSFDLLSIMSILSFRLPRNHTMKALMNPSNRS